jgi:hypothetical protein
MKGYFYLRSCFILLFAIVSSRKTSGQVVTITIPATDTMIITNQTISFEASRSGDFPGAGIIFSFTWTSSPAAGVNFGTPISSGVITSASTTATFTQPGTYLITCAVKRGTGDPVFSTARTVIVYTPNLFSAVNTNPVRAWNINPVTGQVLNGPTQLFTPLVNTAALAKNKPSATDPNGCLYYMENTNFSNTGNVNLYAVNPDGTGNTFITTADINGADNQGLGFVRLGFDALGNGWIVAGDFTNLYLATFVGNGTSPTTITTVGTITISGSGSANEFQNGDLAIEGTGAMYIVANVTGGDTYVYIMNSLAGPTYTLTRRWRLVQPGGANFTVSVNGVAFTQSGSLHVSSFGGLYFIDQNTANSNTGTVECAPVFTLDGLTDLASDQFPLQSALPLTLLSFTANLRNDITTLDWEVENQVDFSHFEVERKTQNSNFTTIGTRTAINSNGRIHYEFNDAIAQSNENAFFYRLKMVDLDGKYSYSKTILVRKQDRYLTGISISPNPVLNIGDATIRFHSRANGIVTVRIIDMAGRVLSSQVRNVSTGTNSIYLNNPGDLPPGTYTIQLTNAGEVSTLKFSVAFK